jgi:predicted Zn-dependent peptidase
MFIAGILLVLLIPLINAYATEPAQGDPRYMTFDAVEFVPSEPDRVVFKNGLVIYLLEDHELPLVTITALLRTGSWLDPPDKVGLAALTGTVMRTGGGGGLSGAQVDDELAQFAGRMNVAIGRHSASASLDVLKKDLTRGLQLFAGALRTPAFDPALVELAKLQAIEKIRRREDEPEAIASREFIKLLYGPNHPSARESSIESVQRISREDLIAFHAHTIHPNGIILGVTGDFMRDEIVASLLEVFGTWEAGTVPQVNIAEVPQNDAQKAVVHFINKDTSQTHIRVGDLSIKENDSDYIPLAIANDILGGDAGVGRVFREVRIKRGLAYSVGSELSTGVYDQGMWLLWAETKLPSTKEVLGQLVANIQRISSEPVSDEELNESKEAYMNSWVFDFSSASKIVNRLMRLEYDGLPKDFFQEARKKVLKVSKEDVLAAAKKHLRLDRVKIIAVGSGGTLPEVLSTFGPVKEIARSSEGPRASAVVRRADAPRSIPSRLVEAEIVVK